MLKNYNLILQSNNLTLQSIIDTVSNMPDATDNEYILQDKTITPTTAQQTVTADEGYDGLNIVTVDAMPTADQATPTISVDETSGLITAAVNQNYGYVSDGIKTGTSQLAFQAAKTIIPGPTSQIAVSADTYVGGMITVQGDDNLVASNIVSGKSIFGVVGTATVDDEGGTGVVDEIIARTITTYTNNRMTSIGACAFRSCTSLTAIDFPVCTSIGSSAFKNCTGLTSVNFPACQTIGAYAFQDCNCLTTVSFPTCTSISTVAFSHCSSLTSISFPVCTSIGNYAFWSCTSLTSVNFPSCTIIGVSAFESCNRLTCADFPACTSVGTYAFNRCYSLASINFPVCSTVGFGAFGNCSSLTAISLPACTGLNYGAFWYCENLTNVSLPVCTSIGTLAFYFCYSLNTIYLMASQVCNLAGSSVFEFTSITSTTGSIFVPASLVDAYKAATNWTYFSNQIFGV